MGTPSYMSPEQCQGKEIDRRSDLFSAGVVLYELLTGEKPFSGSIEAIAFKICYEDPRPPSEISKLPISPSLDAVVATALAKDCATRFQNAKAFNRALRYRNRLALVILVGMILGIHVVPVHLIAQLGVEHAMQPAVDVVRPVIVDVVAVQDQDGNDSHNLGDGLVLAKSFRSEHDVSGGGEQTLTELVRELKLTVPSIASASRPTWGHFHRHTTGCWPGA